MAALPGEHQQEVADKQLERNVRDRKELSICEQEPRQCYYPQDVVQGIILMCLLNLSHIKAPPAPHHVEMSLS